jgi:hypothetical protein
MMTKMELWNDSERFLSRLGVSSLGSSSLCSGGLGACQEHHSVVNSFLLQKRMVRGHPKKDTSTINGEDGAVL